MNHETRSGGRRATYRRLLSARAEVEAALAAVTAADGAAERLRANEDLRRAGRGWAQATAAHAAASADGGRLAQWRRGRQVRADHRLAERVAATILPRDGEEAGGPDWLRDVRR
jgi:hypothetical protein